MTKFAQIYQQINGTNIPVGTSSNSPLRLKAQLQHRLGTDYKYQWRAVKTVGTLVDGTPRLEILWVRGFGGSEWQKTEFFIAVKEKN